MVKAFLKLPAVVVHGRGHAAWALRVAAGRPVLLLSAPGAALNVGPGWFKAVLDQAAAAHPGAPFTAALDCAGAPGAALAALRAGALPPKRGPKFWAPDRKRWIWVRLIRAGGMMKGALPRFSPQYRHRISRDNALVTGNGGCAIAAPARRATKRNPR